MTLSIKALENLVESYAQMPSFETEVAAFRELLHIRRTRAKKARRANPNLLIDKLLADTNVDADLLPTIRSEWRLAILEWSA
jgi:hypothetical protein